MPKLTVPPVRNIDPRHLLHRQLDKNKRESKTGVTFKAELEKAMEART